MTRLPTVYARLFLPALGLFIATSQVFADDADIFAHDHFSVICVESEGVRFNGARETERGTAFFLTKDGIAVTNSHVALDEKNYKELRIRGIVRRGSVLPVEEIEVNLTVLERDTKHDLALLKADKPIPSQFVHVADLKTPIPGVGMTIIGCPIGLGPSLNTAKISNVVDDRLGRWFAEGFVNPGMSGSPVFNSNGRVVGIATAGITSASVDGKPMAIPYPPGIITPFSMVESGIISKRKIKVSRGEKIGSSPPLVLSQVFPLKDQFKYPSGGGGVGGGGAGGGGGPLASVRGIIGGGDFGTKPLQKPKPSAQITRQKEFTAASGYEFTNADVIKQTGMKSGIVGPPVISSDKTKLTIRYATTVGMKPDEIATLDASIRADQIKIGPKPANLQKVFDVYETNASTSDASEITRTITYDPEPGYRFSSFTFIQIDRKDASEPKLQLSEDRRRLDLTFSLVRRAVPDRANGWLVGTLSTSQVLTSER